MFPDVANDGEHQVMMDENGPDQPRGFEPAR
jgi:hypothetical protein